MTTPEDPALMVMTAALADDWDFADRITAEYLDAGNGDLLVEGLVNMASIFANILAHYQVDMSETLMDWDEDTHQQRVAEWWAVFCAGVAVAEHFGGES